MSYSKMVGRIGILENALIIIEKLLAPGYSCCGLCGRPWKFAKEHITNYSPSSGCFPLCQKCWEKLTPQKRLPFYHKLWKEWKNTDVKWEDIKKVVLEGK